MWNIWLWTVVLAGLAIFAVLGMGLMGAPTISTGEGVLTAKTFEAAHTVGRQPAPSAGGGMPARADIHYSDRHVVVVKLDSGIEAKGVISDIGSDKYRVGGRVKVKYQTRGFGPFFRKVMLLEITPVD